MRIDAESIKQHISELAALRQMIEALSAEGNEQDRIDELRLEVERIESTLNSLGVGIYEWDIPYSRIIWNERFCEILGMPLNRLSGDISELLDKIHHEDLASATAAFNAHFEGIESYDTAIRFQQNGGEYVKVSSIGQAVRGVDGRPIVFICSLFEISEGTEAQESDEEFSETPSSTSEQLQSLFVIAADGRFIEATDSFCLMLGYSQTSLFQMNLTELLPPEVASDFLQHLSASEGSLSETIELRASNGVYAKVSLSCSRLSDDNYLCTVLSTSDTDEEVNIEPSAGYWLDNVSAVARKTAQDVVRFLDTTFTEDNVLTALLTTWPYFLFLAVHVIGSVAFFLIENNGQNGWNIVPADDTWIGLTYARNFADTFVFSYNPGESETGMTSPLWVVVLGVLFRILSPIGVELPALAQVAGVMLASATSVFAYLIVVRITGNKAVGVGAGLVIALDPTFAFAKVSGAEVALFTAASFGAIWAFLGNRHTTTGILIGLVVLSRPEGIILAVLFFIAFLGKRLWERENTRLTSSDTQELVILGAPAIIAIAAWVGYNLSVSGLPLPNSYYVKHDSLGLFNASNLSAIWTGYLRNSSYLVNIQPLVTIPLVGVGAYYAFKRVGFQSVPLAVFPLLLIYSFSIFISFPGENWNISTRRYLDPFLPFIIVLLALGAVFVWQVMSDYIDSQINLDPDSQSALQWTRQAVVALLVATSVAAIPFRWPSLATEFSDNTANIADGPVVIARWLDENIPMDSTIAASNPGALKFFSDHSIVDLTGINYHDGIDKGIFSASEIAQADYVVAFDGLYVRSWPFWDPVTFVDIERNTILEGRRLVVYKTSEIVDTTPNDLPLNTSMERLILIDSLDVGNLEDERLHNWQMVPLDNTLVRTFRTNVEDDITDDARITSGQESFRVRTLPGRELVIVKRYDAGVRGVVQVFLNDQQVGVWRLAPRRYFFGEDQFFIPASFIEGDTVELKFVHIADERGETSLNSFYYWFFTTRDG